MNLNIVKNINFKLGMESCGDWQKIAETAAVFYMTSQLLSFKNSHRKQCRARVDILD